MQTSLTAFVLLAVTWLTPPGLAAQIVSGRLLDDESDAPIAGADLFLLDDDDRVAARVLSGDDGSFLLLATENGWYKLRAQRLGYGTTTSAPIDLVAFDSLDVEFRIAPEAIPLAPLTVVGQQRRPEPRDPRLERWGYYERREFYGEKSGFGRFLEGDDLRPTAFTVHDLLRTVHGVHVLSAGGRRTIVRGTGRRGCRFLLNGMASVMIEDVPASSVVAMEVYPGMVAPGDYGGQGCVVVVWTGLRR